MTHRHDGQRGAQVRRVLQQALALVQRLEHQLQLAVVRIEHRLLQVPHAPVHQLGALGGGARGIVLLLHQRCAQTPAQGQME